MEQTELTFIDLFAGIGGMRLAFERNGCKCVYSNEWDKFCQQTYSANFGETPDNDITKVDADSIPDHDILVGGFPCQPFSLAGKKRGFDDTRGTLFFDVCRIIKAKRPRAFMLENVKNLCSHDKGNTFKVIQGALDELDYNIFYKICDGRDYVPQHRERIIIVGFDRKRFENIDFEFTLNPPAEKPVFKDILEQDVDAKYTLTDKMWNCLLKHSARHKAAGNGFGYGIAPLEGCSRTLLARYYKDGSDILIDQGVGKNPRKLTPRECARLQGFPDDFKIVVSDTQAYKQFGNSVVVPLMTDIAGLVINKLLTKE